MRREHRHSGCPLSIEDRAFPAKGTPGSRSSARRWSRLCLDLFVALQHRWSGDCGWAGMAARAACGSPLAVKPREWVRRRIRAARLAPVSQPWPDKASFVRASADGPRCVARRLIPPGRHGAPAALHPQRTGSPSTAGGRYVAVQGHTLQTLPPWSSALRSSLECCCRKFWIGCPTTWEGLLPTRDRWQDASMSPRSK